MPTSKVVKLYMPPDEYEHFSEQAKRAGMALSAYIRQVGLGYEVPEKTDKDAVLELLKAKNELGRLGGLFKYFLGSHEQLPVAPEELRAVLRKIEATQQMMVEEFNKITQSLIKGLKL